MRMARVPARFFGAKLPTFSAICDSRCGRQVPKVARRGHPVVTSGQKHCAAPDSVPNTQSLGLLRKFLILRGYFFSGSDLVGGAPPK